MKKAMWSLGAGVLAAACGVPGEETPIRTTQQPVVAGASTPEEAGFPLAPWEKAAITAAAGGTSGGCTAMPASRVAFAAWPALLLGTGLLARRRGRKAT